MYTSQLASLVEEAITCWLNTQYIYIYRYIYIIYTDCLCASNSSKEHFKSSQKKTSQNQLPPQLFATSTGRNCQKKLLPTSPNHSWPPQISRVLAQNPHTLKRFRKSDGSPSVALDWASSPRFKRENRENPERLRMKTVSASWYVFIYRLGCSAIKSWFLWGVNLGWG